MFSIELSQIQRASELAERFDLLRTIFIAFFEPRLAMVCDTIHVALVACRHLTNETRESHEAKQGEYSLGLLT
jgi:hypothetical protein